MPAEFRLPKDGLVNFFRKNERISANAYLHTNGYFAGGKLYASQHRVAREATTGAMLPVKGSLAYFECGTAPFPIIRNI
jgi:hypothetical protein